MNWLTELYPQVKQFLLSQLPSSWSQLSQLADLWFEETIIPEIIPVLASCKAVGGDPQQAIAVAAAILATEISIRILDDLQDQDRPHALDQSVGVACALNYADAFKTVGFKVMGDLALNNVAIGVKLYNTFIDGYFQVLKGQDRDLKGISNTWENYWQTVEMKTGAGYGTASALGAIVGTNQEELINSCRIYGYHLGLAIQIFNDLEGVWFPDGKSDLDRGKITLPLLYGLTCEHSQQEELLIIVKDARIAFKAEKIRTILDQIDTRNYLVWMAMKHRELALEAIENCPNQEGKEALEARFTAMFSNVEDLTESSFIASKEPETSNSNIAYKSTGLRLRNELRNLS